MKKTTVEYYCDRCGKKIEGGHYRIKPHYYDSEDKEHISDFLIGALDREFCEQCTRVFMIDLQKTAVPDPGPTPKKAADRGGEMQKDEEKKGPGRPRKKPERVIEKNKSQQRKLDDGKIYALRNAGWDWEKIKNELYTDESTETIQEHYEKEKAKREMLQAAAEQNLSAWDDEENEGED